MTVQVSEKAEVVLALYNEMEQLQLISNELSKQSFEIHDRYIKEITSLSEKHKVVLTKIALLQETMEKIIGN